MFNFPEKTEHTLKIVHLVILYILSLQYPYQFVI